MCPRSYPYRSGRAAGSSRRRTEWTAGPLNSTVVSSTSSGALLVSTAQEANEATTVVRIRGEIALWLPVVTTIGDGFINFAAAIGIVSADAFTAGVASVPAPLADPDWGGWLWYHAGASLIGFETTEVLRGPIGAVRIPIDTKAMRKMSPNEAIFGIVEFGTEVGTATVSFVMNTRMLFKLH